MSTGSDGGVTPAGGHLGDTHASTSTTPPLLTSKVIEKAPATMKGQDEQLLKKALATMKENVVADARRGYVPAEQVVKLQREMEAQRAESEREVAKLQAMLEQREQVLKNVDKALTGWRTMSP